MSADWLTAIIAGAVLLVVGVPHVLSIRRERRLHRAERARINALIEEAKAVDVLLSRASGGG